MASGSLADCKFLVCRRQMKRLPSASVSLADGKFLTGYMANINFAIGKLFSLHSRAALLPLCSKLREQTKGLRLEVRKKQALVQTQQHSAESPHEKQVRARVLDRMRRA